MQRSVYHKYAKIEVDVPDNVDARDWLMDNEEKWVNVMDDKISKAKYEFGNGMDTYDWTDKDEDSEWMYMGEDGFGGHL